MHVHVQGISATYYTLEEELAELKFKELRARRERVKFGCTPVWIPGFSCLDLDSPYYKTLHSIKSNPYWQWTMLTINILNVIGLCMMETDPAEAERSTMHSVILPIMDYFASIMFTVDMLIGMMVLGLKSYFDDQFNQLDFFVVVTGPPPIFLP